ncbi:MAG: BamA/TamA family outer membrane protein [Acidobacteria bacterium]|nr:BamA/TamA family outer membrane protein [Acidobacteriota bacterium]
MSIRTYLVAAAVVGVLGASPAGAQPPAAGVPTAPQAQPGPKLPPADSPALLRSIELRFPTQGNLSVIEPQTYLYYIETRPSRSSDGVWTPFDEKAILEDFKRLWATNFLDNIWVEVNDAPYENGVVGKRVVFNLEERQRVKIVDYVGSRKIEQSKIEEKLRDENIQIRLDSFIDPALIRRVEGIIRDMFAEKGYQFAKVDHVIKEVAGGPKLVNVSFVMDEGPRVRIHSVEFVGNKAVSSGALARQMKNNRKVWMFSWITSGGTYQAAKFEEDADKVVEYYRNLGYVMARVGQPSLKFIEDSTDKTTRYVALRIPVQEGERYRVGDFAFDGNTVVKSEGLKEIFNVKGGDYYSEKKIRKAMDKARELYGSVGYYEFTAYPDVKPRGVPAPGEDADNPLAPPKPAAKPAGPPTIDVTMRIQEGKQYFVNRIIFTGNTHTRDNVIRREIRLFEGGVFNTEALKYSVKRLNQLGYFKQLDGGKDMSVDKTPGTDNKVDVKLKLEEQNRNQITFGAGVSQYEGVFGQLTFQTSNFLGKGETLSVSAQKGSRAKNYQISFSEPFLFDRPITVGGDVHKQSIIYPYAYTQNNTGGAATVGFQVGAYARVFGTYSLDQIRVSDIYPTYLPQPQLFFTPSDVYSSVGLERSPFIPSNGELAPSNPYMADLLLLNQGGKRTISKVTPSYVYNSVDNPIFPAAGKRLTAALDVAGIGGDTSYLKPTLEAVWYLQQSRRFSLGVRGQWISITPTGGTTTLPIFERLYLGGEYSVRGFDLRSIGPRDPISGVVVGGVKSLLFNAEYLIQVAGPVRLVLFYDAGQVTDTGQRMTLGDFKTSTGAEIRFFMPVLNVPFRLIAAYNPQRAGVLDNQLQLAKAFTFRFAVGTTF